jgi:hypothetical protein
MLPNEGWAHATDQTGPECLPGISLYQNIDRRGLHVPSESVYECVVAFSLHVEHLDRAVARGCR